MNILFCNSFNVSEIKGGTERITARISKGLTERGHHCFLAYKIEIEDTLPLSKFDDSINVRKASLEDFILRHKIDVIIIQKMTRDVKLFCSIRKKNGLDFKIYSVLHFAPRFEEGIMNFNKAWNDLKNGSNSIKDGIKNIVRILSYPIYKIYYPNRNRNLYQVVYNYSDRVVLLSNSFVDEYSDFCHLEDKSKFIVIPNALSYDVFLPIGKFKEKKQQTLVVSRLVESEKRVSLAIKAWDRIMRDEDHERLKNEWSLKIVGTGSDEDYYKNFVKELGLKNVEFCGRQQPKPYYEESAIFLMTSAKEGWGLTLTEAQQFGCVPIAFDSFSSLKDIITDGVNGFIIPNNDIETYTKKLMELMTNQTLCQKIAKNAIEQSKRYKLDKVISAWEKLINHN